MDTTYRQVYRDLRHAIKNRHREEAIQQRNDWGFVCKVTNDIWFTVTMAIVVCTVLFMMAGCVHAQELTASWYSVQSLKTEGTWKYSKGRMANGHIFSDSGLTCATRLFPLGATLRIQERISKRFVDVKVTDKIGKRFAKTRIDLSKAAFNKIANLNRGLIRVDIERII